MDNYFGEWYAKASITYSDDLLKKRWEGVEKVRTTASSNQLLDLVRLFRGVSLRETDFEAAFRKIFFDIDSTFAPRGNELEVRVLAGSTIAALIAHAATKKTIGTQVSLSLLCSEFQGLAAKSPIDEIAKRANTYLGQQAEQIRPNVMLGSLTPIPESLKESLKQLEESAEDAEEIVKNTKSAVDAITATVNSFAPYATTLAHGYNLLLEEANILWWLFAEFSNELQKPFAKAPPMAAPLVVAKELGDLTIYQPGRISVPAILAKALKTIKRLPNALSIQQSLAELDAGVRHNWVTAIKNPQMLDFCPISTCLVDSDHSGHVASAVTAGETKFSLNAGQEVVVGDFSLQFFREWLLLSGQK